VSDLSPLEVAAETGLSRSLIYREIERGNLSAYRIGARLRVEPEAVALWKERCRVRPRMEPPIYEPCPLPRARGSSSVFADELAAIERGGGRAA
jgi:excisionase family DNA binding protein